MEITIMLFATLKDKMGTNRLTFMLSKDNVTVTDLKAQLAEQVPAIADYLPTVLVAVNQEFALADQLINPGDEVALFPPVSGGGNAGVDVSDDAAPTIFHITNDEIDLNDLTASITRPATGAVCIFTGVVRGITSRDDAHNTPHNTDYLEYEAYVPMAEAKMRQVADEIRERWPIVAGIAVVQRIGRLQPGTPTVLIACSAGHRDTGVFEAARYGIDRLKEIVPIWKKEVGPDGQEWVAGSYTPGAKDRA